MEFCRQEYWSGLPFPSSGDLPDTGSKPWSLALQADSLPYNPPGKTILEDPLGTSHQKFFSKKYFANIKIMKKSCGLCMCMYFLRRRSGVIVFCILYVADIYYVTHSRCSIQYNFVERMTDPFPACSPVLLGLATRLCLALETPWTVAC